MGEVNVSPPGNSFGESLTSVRNLGNYSDPLSIANLKGKVVRMDFTRSAMLSAQA